MTAAQQNAAQALADEHGRVVMRSEIPFKVDVWGDLRGALSGYAHLGVAEISDDGEVVWEEVPE